mmetsp:Transcript_12684/g.17992  ORF Transcript_12684/g.17992 Transcript_12684/m.17992 type:complete len:249 (-) Transcript_12684:80-826(-)
MKIASLAFVSLLSTVSAFASTSKPTGIVTHLKAETTDVETSASSSKPMFDSFLDEDAMLAESTFPIKPNDLMERAKYLLSPDCGIGTKDGGECLAEDFEFIAAVVGPIGREEYLNALGSFNLEDAFDITPNFFGMSVDPMQPNRVWFFNRVKGIHKGEFMGAKPDGKEIVYPPQVQHFDFNEDGKLKEYGFYTADRRQGNTGGLGGAFGFMYGVGKPLPIPECQPYKRSFRFRLLNFVGSFAQKLSKK